MFAVGVGNPETVKEADLILKDLTEYKKNFRITLIIKE